MKTLTLISQDIHCESCANSIQKAVGAVAGVTSVHVDVASQTATITYDDPATEQQVRAAMEDAGFDLQ